MRWKVFLISIFVIFLMGFASARTCTLCSGSGAIWTTNVDCGDETQDVNVFARGDFVFINGAGFDPGTYDWDIMGNPGGSSADPEMMVASGTHTVGSTGIFCFKAYRVAMDDWGEYNVEFSDKGDNYRVDPGLDVVECELTGVYWEVTTALEGDEVRFKVRGTPACDEDTISFIIKEKDSFPNPNDDVKIEPERMFFESSQDNYGYWIAEGQNDDDTDLGENYPPEYFLIAKVGSTGNEMESSNLLQVLKRDIVCAGVNYCSDYISQEECERDSCGVGKDSVPDNIFCGEKFNEVTGCTDNTDCRCYWDSSSEICEAGWNVESICDEDTLPVGDCIYSSFSNDDTCDDDGMILVTQVASWIWAPGNEQSMYDPLGLHFNCIDRETVFICPQSVEIPFFGFYNFIAAILITLFVYLGYSVFSRDKK